MLICIWYSTEMSVSEVVAGVFFFGVFSKLNDEKKKTISFSSRNCRYELSRSVILKQYMHTTIRYQIQETILTKCITYLRYLGC